MANCLGLISPKSSTSAVTAKILAASANCALTHPERTTKEYPTLASAAFIKVFPIKIVESNTSGSAKRRESCSPNPARRSRIR